MQAASVGVAMQLPQLASATFKLVSFKHQIASPKPAGRQCELKRCQTASVLKLKPN